MSDWSNMTLSYDALAKQVGVGAVQRSNDEPWAVFIKLPVLEMDLTTADARRVAKALLEYALYSEKKNPKPKKAKVVKKKAVTRKK